MNLTGLVMGLAVAQANNLPPSERIQVGVIGAVPRSPVMGLVLAEALARSEAPAPTGPLPLSLSGPSTSNPGIATLNVPYSLVLVASGGVPQYTFSLLQGDLPDGLTWPSSSVSSSGVFTITGTPNGDAGTYYFFVQVTDSQTPTQNQAALGVEISVVAAQQPGATPQSLNIRRRKRR